MNGTFSKLTKSLKKTRDVLGQGLRRLRFSQGEEAVSALDDLEELLIQADIGAQAAFSIRDRLEQSLHNENQPDLTMVVKKRMLGILRGIDSAPVLAPAEVERPYVILVAGVNGSGKTTTAGKLAAYYSGLGHRVLLGASDTFRAAASEQLKVWADRTGAAFVTQKPGADPASVAYDAVTSAKARGHDVVIIDTAGRLHTRVNLMMELSKIRRVTEKAHSGAPHQCLLVLDATVGQNALSQARLFHEAIDVDGLVLAKIDGSAKGGAIFPIATELGIPVRWLGIGEGVDDLEPFAPDSFVDALLSAE